MSEKKLLNDNFVNFFAKKEEYKSLSNFWIGDVYIFDHDDDRVFSYESGEHCFHGEKYRRIGLLCENGDRRQQLLEYSSKFMKPSYKSPSDVKKMGGK